MSSHSQPIETGTVNRLPQGLKSKESACHCKSHRRWGFNPWVRKIRWKRKWQATLIKKVNMSYVFYIFFAMFLLNSVSLSLVTKLCPTLATPWTVACQTPLSMGFSRQEYWSWLPFPSPGDLPDSLIEPESPSLQPDSLPTELWGKPSYSNSV